MLQTDVMRFFAIIALCLVAVFALVQSMVLVPAKPVDRDQETMQNLKQEVQRLSGLVQRQQEVLYN